MRLVLGELLQIAEEIAHRNSLLRDEGRRILDQMLAELQNQLESEGDLSNPTIKAERSELRALRRELQSSWLRVDSLIDDLLSTAADELTQFVALAETRTGKFERDVRHRAATNSLRDGTDRAEPI